MQEFCEVFPLRTITTIITWNRLQITRDTLKTFIKHNGRRDLLFVDNGSTDRTVKYLRKRHYEVLKNDANLGIFMATRRAWLESHARGYDFILNLQNDFPCIRKIPFDELESYFDNNPDVGFVQLNDKGRLLFVRSDGSIKIRKKPRIHNYLTKEPLVFEKWDGIADNKICKGNHHMSFNPVIFRASLVPILVGEIIKPRERHIMEQFNSTKLKSAKLYRRCFETVIRSREKEWIH